MSEQITNHWEYEEALVRERGGLRAENERLRGIETAARQAADIYEAEIERLRALVGEAIAFMDNRCIEDRRWWVERARSALGGKTVVSADVEKANPDEMGTS